MKQFLDENFLLSTVTAQRLYYEYAAVMPIIDYHNHLPPDEVAVNKQFENITKVWLNGDHYKWRAMRTNGVDESYITGDKADWEKFQADFLFRLAAVLKTRPVTASLEGPSPKEPHDAFRPFAS